jgi:NADPH-dependent 2,4-dienoyl-CoA reductase/sulfur reductase-like enzyme/rhodanese-related sulfurtransferase
MSKRIIIIGGLSAGPSAAAKARRTDEQAEIILIEKGENISYATCGLPYALSGVIQDRKKLVVVTPQLLRERFNIDVHLNEEVLEINPKDKLIKTTKGEYKYDKLVYALGSKEIIPPLANLDKTKLWSTVRTMEDFDKLMVDLKAESARKIAVLGGGLIGIETAENLQHMGAQVTIIEGAPQILGPWDQDFAELAEGVLQSKGILFKKGHFATAVVVNNDGILTGIEVGGEVIPCDYLIISAGIRPNTAMLTSVGAEALPNGAIKVNEQMETSIPDVYAAGDCASIKNLVTGEFDYFPMGTHSNKGGRAAGSTAAGVSETFKGALGTAIVHVFGYTLARTGLNKRQLEAKKLEHAEVFFSSGANPGFFPGTKELLVRIYYRPSDGRLWGAQIMGEKGADKRIDVLATALYAGLKLDDLAQLDLAYAPQYNAAKDPLVVAGHIHSNISRKQVEFILPRDLKTAPSEEYAMIDVRTVKEQEAGMIPGAQSFPLDKLRNQLADIPKNKPLLVYCQKGLRGYLACRILQSYGFTTKNLAGGYKAWEGWK